MERTNYIQLVLNCGSWQEAQAIADELLNTHLIACAEFMEIKSRYAWKNTIESSDEVKIIMQSIGTNFTSIEKVVRKLHSYEIFVLEALPLSHVSKEASMWLHTSLKSTN